VVSFGTCLVATEEGHVVLQVSGNSQIALPNVYAYDALVMLWDRVRMVDFQAHQQVELLAGFVAPESGCANTSVCWMSATGRA